MFVKSQVIKFEKFLHDRVSLLSLPTNPAIDLDTEITEADVIIPMYFIFQFQLTECVVNFRRAIQVNPCTVADVQLRPHC